MASETIVDIVREMCALGQFNEKSTEKIPRSFLALELRTYSARIKAAAKREHKKFIEEHKKEDK